MGDFQKVSDLERGEKNMESWGGAHDLVGVHEEPVGY